MRILRSRRPVDSEESGGYWISFSDLMAALLAVFILAVVVLAINIGNQQLALEEQQIESELLSNQYERQIEEFDEQVSDLQSSEQIRATIVQEIQQELEAQGIEVFAAENHSVLSIPSEQLGFDASDYAISPSFEPTATAIGSAVSRAIQRENRFEHLDTVFVEGHTDNVAFDGLEGTGNWGLSTFRAISLWTHWEEELPAEEQLTELESASGNQLFSVSGYAETRPTTEEQRDATQRAANRRIDIRFTIMRPSSETMEDLGEQFRDGETP